MSRERERYWEEDEIGKRIRREIDAAAVISKYQVEIMGRRQMTRATEVNNEDHHHHHHKHQLNSITPCAACKLLRRRCAEECPFSPYFSPHEPHKFAAVHKVFGASNVSKMLMEVPENQRADAANSLVYEANVRLRDPVYGCMGAISALQQHLQTLQSELNVVRSQILKCKFREEAAAAAAAISPAAPPTPPPQQQPTPPSTPPPPPPPPSFASLSTHHHHTPPYFG